MPILGGTDHLMLENKEYPSILVLIATLNEERGIGITLSEIDRFLNDYYILIVDGKSEDGTVHTAKSLGADVIFQEGKGKGDAISYALQYLEGNFDYVVFTDGDYTYPAEFIPKMIKILEKNPSLGMVCGNRFNTHLHFESMPDIFYFGNRLIAFIHNLLNGVSIRDPLTGLRVMRWELVKNWKPRSVGFDIEVELNRYIERRGYKIAEIEIPYRSRVGSKKLKLKDGLAILKRIIIESGV